MELDRSKGIPLHLLEDASAVFDTGHGYPRKLDISIDPTTGVVTMLYTRLPNISLNSPDKDKEA